MKSYPTRPTMTDERKQTLMTLYNEYLATHPKVEVEETDDEPTFTNPQIIPIMNMNDERISELHYQLNKAVLSISNDYYPHPMPTELEKFLCVRSGTELSVNHVVTLLRQYTKERNLIVGEGLIKPDEKLKSLFKLQDNTWLYDNRLHLKVRELFNDGHDYAESGFTKPAMISDELADLIDVPRLSLMSRVRVSQRMNEYFKTHGLQNPANKKMIIPDERLTALFKLQSTDELSYFNLQKWLSPHFIKIE
jgi:hypothetical protein